MNGMARKTALYWAARNNYPLIIRSIRKRMAETKSPKRFMHLLSMLWNAFDQPI